MTKPTEFNLDVDLNNGVVPISKAASQLAALLKRARANHQPIIITQKGYPSGTILDIELFVALREHALTVLAATKSSHSKRANASTAAEPTSPPPVEEAAPPAAPGRPRHRRQRHETP